MVICSAPKIIKDLVIHCLFFIFIFVFNGKGRWWFQLCYKYYNRLYFIVQIFLSEKLAEKPQTDGLHN